MTGRELIVHILKNRLEDNEVFVDGKFLDFMTINKFASEMGVGPHTVELWIKTGAISAIKIGDEYLIHPESQHRVLKHKVSHDIFTNDLLLEWFKHNI